MINDELVIDLFAGGGGASTGIEMALGVSPDIAINHDKQAIALHEANHPHTQHFIEDIFEVDPIKVCGTNPVGLMWMSPDCKHFSKAKGSKPVSCDIRSLAWVGVKWAKAVRPRVIILENVEEFQDWGPICENNRPILAQKGETFELFVQAFKDIGYQVEWKELRASDFGAPTIRKRLFLIARCDGMPIVFPKPTHGDPKKYPMRLPWATAAECIDWSIPAHSIFLTKEEGKKAGVKRPLAENTMKRIAKGMKKFVIDNDDPFIVKDKVPYVSTFYGQSTGSVVDSPLGTITSGGIKSALVLPYVSTYYGSSTSEQNPRGNALDAPVGTITAGGSRHAVVVPFVTEHANGSSQRNMALDEPLRTICANVKGGHFALVQAFLEEYDLAAAEQTSTENGINAYMMKYYGVGEGQKVTDPAHTITTKDRFALIEVHNVKYEVVDICMRMFTPRELYTAQGFPKDYKIDIEYNGKPLPKTAQVRMCGNSVVPLMAKLLVECNFYPVEAERSA